MCLSEISLTVTFLMAVYNGDRYLAESIESVLGQDDSDFEFLIIDDASTDGTAEILNRFAQQDSRIRVISNPTNLGLTRSLNVGLKHTTADLVARIDADDTCAPGRLRLQRQYMQANSECMVLGSAAAIIDQSGTVSEQQKRCGLTEGIATATLFFSNPLIHSSVIFRREPVVRLGGYDEEFVRAQDYDLWLRCVEAGYRISSVQEQLVFHRLHNGRVTIQQPTTMAKCRRSAVARGITGILGLQLSPDFVEIIEHLRLQCELPKDVSWKTTARQFRSFRNHFATKFREMPDAIEEFDKTVRKLCGFMIPDVELAKDPWLGFVTGSSALSSNLHFARLKFGYLLCRARFFAGRIKRLLTGQTDL
jgi:glycosyltransferase involved in cell wall biosynthesis